MATSNLQLLELLIKAQNPNMSKANLDLLTKAFEIKRAQQMSEAGVAPEDVPTDPTQQAVLMNQIEGGTYEKPLNATQKKQADAKKEIDRILGLMENIYFGGKDLSYGRLGGIVQKVGTKISGEFNPILAEYSATRNSIRPKLVAAMGDSGNFSASEQAAAIGAIPDATNSLEEAVAGFKFARQKFGIADRDYSTLIDRPVNEEVVNQLEQIKNAALEMEKQRNNEVTPVQTTQPAILPIGQSQTAGTASKFRFLGVK